MAILSAVPEGSNVLDLEAARVARSEARGDIKQFLKLTVGYVEVLPEIPLDAAYLFKDEMVKEGLMMLLADPADIDLVWSGLTGDDFQSIVEYASSKSLGESLAYPELLTKILRR